MALKEEYIAKLERIPTVSFNKEQKQIAKKIIENTADNDLNAVYNLITQRVKTGFVFDEAPEVNHDAVALIKENRELGINIDFDGKLEHKLIIGENYDALKNLCATYIDKNGKGLIDVIYIDPPYNTETSKADGNNYKEEIKAEKFIYRDKFTRDGWLNMLNERLKLAKRLLSDMGVIFISIDDSEQAYLKVLCDEIFGEENFVATLIITSAPAGTQSSIDFAVQQSYCHVYKKTSLFHTNSITLSKETVKTKFNCKDKKGIFYEERLWKRGVGGRKEDVPSLHFPVYYDEKQNKIYIDDEAPTNKNLIKIIPYQTKGVLGRWTWSKEKMKKEKEDLSVIKVAGEYKLHKKVYFTENIGQKPFSIIDSKIGRTELGSLEIKKIFNDKVFSYPKYSQLIKHFINLHTRKDSTILDFYAGSGTTGQAVMELNEEDGGKRKFILVTNNENGIGEKITRERLYRVINGKGSNGEKIEWTYTKEKPYLTNNAVRVFNIETTELTLQDLEKAEELKEKTKLEFKKLNENYHLCNDFDIYNDLSALNPLKQNDGEK